MDQTRVVVNIDGQSVPITFGSKPTGADIDAAVAHYRKLHPRQAMPLAPMKVAKDAVPVDNRTPEDKARESLRARLHTPSLAGKQRRTKADVADLNKIIDTVGDKAVQAAKYVPPSPLAAVSKGYRDFSSRALAGIATTPISTAASATMMGAEDATFKDRAGALGEIALDLPFLDPINATTKAFKATKAAIQTAKGGGTTKDVVKEAWKAARGKQVVKALLDGEKPPVLTPAGKGGSTREAPQVSREEYVKNRPKPHREYETDTVETLSKNLPDEGKPGFNKEPYYVSTNAKLKNTPATPEEAINYVYRDESGKPVGVLQYTKGMLDQEPGLTVAVSPEHQRKGIATKLYDMAEADGLPVEDLIGKQGLTEEGALFHYGRAEKRAAKLPEARDFATEHATQITAVPSTYQDAAARSGRTVEDLATETRKAADDLSTGAPEPGGTVPGAKPSSPPLRPPDAEVPPATGSEGRPGQELTGLARRFEDAERANRNLPPTERAARSLEAIADDGENAVKAGTINPEGAIADSLKTGRGLTPEEVAGVGKIKRNLVNRYEALLEKISDADPAQRVAFREELDQISSQLDNISQAAQNTRTSWHEGGMALQIAFDKDFKVASVLSEARSINGAPLSERSISKLEKLANENTRLEKELAGLRNELDILYKNKAKTVKGVGSKDIAIRREALTKRLSQRLGVAMGEPAGAGAKSKQAGFVAVPTPQALLKAIAKDAKALAQTIIQSGAKDLEEVLKGLREAVPDLQDEEWLSLLSGSYREKLISADMQKLAITDAMRSLRSSAAFREKHIASKGLEIATETALGLSRPFKAGFDVSILNVQGSSSKFTNPGVWISSWAPQIKTIFKGEKAVLRQAAERGRDPLYAKAKQAKLDILGMGTGFQSHEETFAVAQRLMEVLRDADTGKALVDVPAHVAGEAMYRSEASATEAMNALRFGIFKKFAKAAPDDAGYLETVARMVNVATGRPVGHLRAAALNKYAGNTFFAPGYWASKYQYATFEPLRYAIKHGEWKAAGHIAVHYGKHIGTLTVVAFGLKKALESLKDKDGKPLGTINLDPRSSDFGKGQFGDYTFDLFHQQAEPVRIVAQMLAGKFNQKGKYTGPNTFQAIMTGGMHIKNKLAPLPRAAANAALGVFDANEEETRPFEFSKDVPSSFEPMGFQKMHEKGFSWPLTLNLITDVERRRMANAQHDWEWSWDKVREAAEERAKKKAKKNK